MLCKEREGRQSTASVFAVELKRTIAIDQSVPAPDEIAAVEKDVITPEEIEIVEEEIVTYEEILDTAQLQNWRFRLAGSTSPRCRLAGASCDTACSPRSSVANSHAKPA